MNFYAERVSTGAYQARLQAKLEDDRWHCLTTPEVAAAGLVRISGLPKEKSGNLSASQTDGEYPVITGDCLSYGDGVMTEVVARNRGQPWWRFEQCFASDPCRRGMGWRRCRENAVRFEIQQCFAEKRGRANASSNSPENFHGMSSLIKLYREIHTPSEAWFPVLIKRVQQVQCIPWFSAQFLIPKMSPSSKR